MPRENLRYWNEEWPNLNSISIAWNSMDHYLPPAAMGVFFRLVGAIASKGVNSWMHDASDDPSLPTDEKTLALLASCTKAQFRKAWPWIKDRFTESNGALRLKDNSIIKISPPDRRRQALSRSTKEFATSRNGRRCAYCGNTDGPFHFDHIFPVILGGDDDPSNIVLACAPCNLSKGGKTLEEWICSRALSFTETGDVNG